MEDLKRRLEFRNGGVQLQAIKKLISNVENRKWKDLISKTTPTLPELNLLFELSVHQDTVVATGCCDALVYLVRKGEAEFKYILHQLLNVAPSARNGCGIVKAVSELIQLEAELLLKERGRYQCPYGIRSNPHPFVTLLSNRPDIWPTMHQQFHTFTRPSSCAAASLVVDVIEPFLKYVLLDPTAKNVQAKISLHQLCLQMIQTRHTELKTRWKKLLTTAIIPALPIEDSAGFGLTVSFLQLLCSAAVRDNDDEAFAEFVSFQLILLVPEMIRKGLDIGYSLDNLISCKETLPETLSRPDVVALLAELITSVPASHHVIKILQLAKLIINDASSETLVPEVIGMLAMPLLRAVTNNSSNPDKPVQVHAVDLLKGIQQRTRRRANVYRTTMRLQTDDEGGYIRPEGHVFSYTASLAEHFHYEPKSIMQWLNSVLTSLNERKSTVSSAVANLIVAIFLTTNDQLVQKLCLDIFPVIGKIDPAKGFDFLPVLLYMLKIECCESTKYTILTTIPLLASNKINVGPILKVLHTFSAQPTLRPLTIRLFTILWQKQERCYPQLLKLIVDDDSAVARHSDWNELMIAKATSIRLMCRTKPHQLGGDLLAPLSKILNECNDDTGSIATAVALDALCALIESEVVDLKTAWTVLAAKLSEDSRPLVISKICNLFSQAAIAEEESEEAAEFQKGIVNQLWVLSRSENDLISRAAYRALSNFKAEAFTLSHMSSELQEEFKPPSRGDDDDNEAEMTHNEMPVPGACFVKMVDKMRPDVRKDYYAGFVSRLAEAEVSSLPRGIHHSSVHGRRIGSGNADAKALAEIPATIQQTYEQNKNPALRPSLAASLLFCYDPPVKVGRDGRPRKHYIISHGHTYEHMLSTLIQEVSIQPSEWHLNALVPQAWSSFMDRMFAARLAAYLSELETQLQHGEYVTAEHIERKKGCGWLWIRDKTADLLRNAAKGNPSVQANSLLALAGLAVAVNRYVTNQDPDVIAMAEDSTEHLKIGHWTLTVVETIFRVLDHTYKPKTNIFQWGQSIVGSLSVLARSSACLAIVILTPILVTMDTDLICKALSLMTSGLPGRQDSDLVPPTLQFHHGLGLGMFLGRLAEEHFEDVSGTKGLVTTWKAIEELEAVCFTEAANNRCGSLLGLGWTLSALCCTGKMDNKVHATATLDKLTALLDKSKSDSTDFEAMCFCVALVTSTAYNANSVTSDKAGIIAETLFQVHQANNKIAGVSLALGHLCYSMRRTGHSLADGIHEALYSTWMKSFLNQKSNAEERFVCLSGLMGLIGSERSLISVHSDVAVHGLANRSELIRLSTQLITSATSDPTLRGTVSWMLGHLYLSTSAIVETRSSVPASLSYLPETSILRALVDFVLSAGRLGPERIAEDVLLGVFEALHAASKVGPIPPVNWPGLLSAIMRMPFGDEVKYFALKLVLTQCAAAPTAAMFMASWMTSPLFETLSKKCQLVVYESMAVLVNSTTIGKLKPFLQQTCAKPFNDRHIHGGLEVIRGLRDALRIANPAQSVIPLLYDLLSFIYEALPGGRTSTPYAMLDALCECFAEVPDDVFDDITVADFTTEDSELRAAFVRCCLVGNGKQPIALINRFIDHALSNPDCNRDEMIWFVSQSFQRMALEHKVEFTGPMPRLQWFLEYLGHVKNTLKRHDDEAVLSAEKKQKIIEFALRVFLMAVLTWSNSESTALVHLGTPLHNESPASTPLGSITQQYFISLIPQSLTQFAKIEPWKQINLQIIDWLVMLHGLAKSELKLQIRECVTAMRCCEEYLKIMTWSKVVLL
ncbi:focadhesin-like [Tubulanus polymorphus]|uniref:focadhesin-like n=1 Tax=Tubulanus polymorphus TaxID=672921 RepID=UPI003DA4A21C